jgi:hypothetical protein
VIPWVERHAAERWREWTDRHPRGLRTAIITAARHRNEKLTILIADRFGPPRVVAKVGRSRRVANRIAAEHRALLRARRELPPAISARGPEPLDLVSIADGTALFTTALRGRRPVFPQLLSATDRAGKASVERYLTALMRWATEVDRVTRRQTTQHPDPALTYLERFPSHQDAERFAHLAGDARSWQHGDPALGNVLLARRGFGIIDWEYASPDKLPWHDLAYLVLQMALHAAHQTRLPPVEALRTLYRPGSWCGDLVHRHITEVWRYPVSIPEGVALTAMALAVERDDAGNRWKELASSIVSGKGPAWLRV